MIDKLLAGVAAASLLAAGGCATAGAAAPADVAGATATFTHLVDDLYGTRQERIYDAKLIWAEVMAQAGYQARTYTDLRNTIHAKWQLGVAYEKGAAADDTSCRTDLHDYVMVLGADRVRKLIDENAGTLAAIRAQRAAHDAAPGR